MKALYRILLASIIGTFAAPAFAEGGLPPIPEPYRTPPSPLKPIPGPCPPPHTDVEKVEKTPRPEPYVPDIRVPPMRHHQ